jgi:PAS domain S-box-containing protein
MPNSLKPIVPPAGSEAVEVPELKLLLETLHERMPMGIATVDVNLHVLRVNTALTQELGVDRGAALGKSLKELMGSLIPSAVVAVQAAIDGGQSVLAQEYSGKLPGSAGLHRWQIHAHPLIAARVVGALLVLVKVALVADTEAEFTASAERLREVIDALPEGMLVHVNHRIVLANKVAATLHGMSSPQEMIGRSDLEFAPSAAREALLRYGELVLQGQRQELDVEQRAPSGEMMWIQATGTRTTVANQPAVLVTLRDITQRKRIEMQLRESEERYRLLMESMPDAVLVYRDRLVVYANAATATMLGLPSVQPLIGRNVVELAHPSERALIEQKIDELQRHGTTQPAEVVISVDEHGNARWAESRAVLIQFEGAPAVQVIMSEVTQRKRTEQALRESEERYRALIEESPDGILVHDQQRILLANDAMARMHGFDAVEQMVGRSVMDIVPDSELGAFAAYQQRLSTAGSFVDEIKIVNRRTGAVLWAEASAKAIQFHGQPAVQVMCRDVTERRLAAQEVSRLNETLEERVKQRTQELQAAVQELEAFSYSVSHDLRAPLRHISGHVSLLLERPSVAQDQEAQRHAERAGSAAERLGRLVDDLLHFSRMGRTELRTADISMHGLVQEIQREFDTDTRERNIVWAIADLPNVPGDAAMLKQVWQNLIGNALKYTRPRSEVRIDIGAMLSTAHVTYYIRDNGVGFDPRYSDKLFGVFERLHSVREFEGNGIGLAHVRRIVQRHGGKVWAEGEIDGGATFYFSLPVSG